MTARSLPSREGAAGITFLYNGAPLPARLGDSVASALLALDRRVLRAGPEGTGRGVFCGIGVCFDCLVTVDGRPGQRACMVAVRPGLRVEGPAP